MKTSKRAPVLVILLLFFIGTCLQHAGRLVVGQSMATSQKLQIRAVLTKDETKGVLLLEWSLKNISKKDVAIRDTNVLHDYSFLIKDHRGNIVRPTEAGQQKLLEYGIVGHRYSKTLHPREEIRNQLVITEIYDFKPGEAYSVNVVRSISFDQGKTFEQIRSNAVRVLIKPRA